MSVAPDPLLRRIERTAAFVCVAMAVAALAITRGDPAAAAAVVAGWLLIEVSFRMIASGIEGMIAPIAAAGSTALTDARGRRLVVVRTVARLAGRYALLALLAYVMIARLRLHPVGLLAGVSSIVAAASVEAVRLLVKKHHV
jgi:hypothetical protein